MEKNNIIDSGCLELHAPGSTASEEVESVAPEQTGEYPRWEFKPRQNPKWGEVTKQGLIVGRGSNRRVVPPDEVYKLAALGCTIEEMSDFFQVNRETLKYNFSDYILKGKAELKWRLRSAMLRNAINNNNAAVQIFLAKNILGMSDSPMDAEANQPLPWDSVE